MHTSDTISIAIPRAYRDASTVSATAAVEPAWLVIDGVRIVGGSARGRERIAMTTPHETTAMAIFARKKNWGGGVKGEGETPSARVGGPFGGEREGKVRYNLMERVSFAHEDAAEEHGHDKSYMLQLSNARYQEGRGGGRGEK